MREKLTKMELAFNASSFSSGLIDSWWSPAFTICEFKASFDFALGGLKRDTVSTNQARFSSNFLT